MDINAKTIGNISIERWKEAFGKAVAIAMENDFYKSGLNIEDLHKRG